MRILFTVTHPLFSPMNIVILSFCCHLFDPRLLSFFSTYVAVLIVAVSMLHRSSCCFFNFTHSPGVCHTMMSLLCQSKCCALHHTSFNPCCWDIAMTSHWLIIIIIGCFLGYTLSGTYLLLKSRVLNPC